MGCPNNDNEPLGMEVGIVEIRNAPGEWLVEAIDYGSEGEIYRAIFSGLMAEERARAYAAFAYPAPAGDGQGVNIFVHADDCEMSRVDASFNCTCGAKPSSEAQPLGSSERQRAVAHAPRDTPEPSSPPEDELSKLSGGWEPIETAPKTSQVIHVWADGYEWPETVRWLPYGPDEAEEVGEEGYWTYAEELLAEATDDCCSDQWTHWRPLPALPQEGAPDA